MGPLPIGAVMIFPGLGPPSSPSKEYKCLYLYPCSGAFRLVPRSYISTRISDGKSCSNYSLIFSRLSFYLTTQKGLKLPGC